jgi:NAD(P)-dependent dehydrogenase (short-subunit alcohol dehydrogenase family)
VGLVSPRRGDSSGQGAYVFITGRRQKRLDAPLKEIGKTSGIQGDVAKLADLDRLYDAMKAKTGRNDILFAHASFAELAPVGEITEEQFDGMLDNQR